MIVKTNSWHYRFNFWKTNRSRITKHNTLCSYFWFTVWNMFWCLFWAVFPFAILGALGFALVSDLKYSMLSWWSENPDGVLQVATYPLIGVVFLASIIATMFAVVFSGKGIGFIWVKAFGKGRKDKPVKPKKEPGLLGSYLQARKEKFCPVIKFEDVK